MAGPDRPGDGEAPAGALVVLVGGVALGGIELLVLWALLRVLGHRARIFFYVPWYEPVDATAARLERWLVARGAPAVHLVGHSLGGIVILRMLAAGRWRAPGRVVTLGTPHRDISAARHVARTRAGRLAIGGALRSALDRVPVEVPPGRALGVIAGNVSFGLGRLLGVAPPSDSMVGIAEAMHPQAADARMLRVSHGGLIVSPAVARETDAFLRTGAFLDTPPGADATLRG